jgi:integrase
MNTVEPIRDKGKIIDIKNKLKKEKSPRNYLLFTLGINTAFRISDLLRLKVKDILDDNRDIRRHIYIRVQKTGKELKPKINASMIEAINHYLKGTNTQDPETYLFTSDRSNGSLSKVMCWYLINKWTREVELEGNYGTHSLRKTWGYQARQAGMPLELISEKLGHSTIQETRKYIGITQDEVNNWEDKINL